MSLEQTDSLHGMTFWVISGPLRTFFCFLF